MNSKKVRFVVCDIPASATKCTTCGHQDLKMTNEKQRIFCICKICNKSVCDQCITSFGSCFDCYFIEPKKSY